MSPAFRVEEGDRVTVGQCRPLSKTVRIRVLEILPNLHQRIFYIGGRVYKSFESV